MPCTKRAGSTAGRLEQALSQAPDKPRFARNGRGAQRQVRRTRHLAARAQANTSIPPHRVLDREALRRERKLSLSLTAKVKDPAGHTRTVKKTVRPKLKRKRR